VRFGSAGATVAVAVVFALSGCGGGDKAQPTAQGPPIKTITVTETDFKLNPATVTVDKPGVYAFHAVNNGQSTHALEIEGSGVEGKTGEIGPGESADLKVEITKPGDYEMYCPVDGHKDMGMEGKLTLSG
jgi:uncharacterized cupredoxin-like copper-binding protein